MLKPGPSGLMGLATPLSGSMMAPMGAAIPGMDPKQKVAMALMGQKLLGQIGKMAQPGMMPRQDSTKLDLYGNPLR